MQGNKTFLVNFFGVMNSGKYNKTTALGYISRGNDVLPVLTPNFELLKKALLSN